VLEFEVISTNEYSASKYGLCAARDGKPGEKLWKVIEAIQGPIKVNKCLLGTNSCPRRPQCAVSGRLVELQEYIEGYLRGITLAEFLKSSSNKTKAKKPKRKT